MQAGTHAISARAVAPTIACPRGAYVQLLAKSVGIFDATSVPASKKSCTGYVTPSTVLAACGEKETP